MCPFLAVFHTGVQSRLELISTCRRALVRATVLYECALCMHEKLPRRYDDDGNDGKKEKKKKKKGTMRTGTAHCAAMTDDGHLSPDYRFTSSMSIRQLQTQRHMLSSLFSSSFLSLPFCCLRCLSVPRRGHVHDSAPACHKCSYTHANANWIIDKHCWCPPTNSHNKCCCN